MAITTAIQRGSYVYVYNEKNVQTNSYQGTLQGYTSTTVSVRRDDYIYVYNDKGQQISSHFSK